MKRKYIWQCECKAGWCDFDTKREAEEEKNGKFCGKFIGIKKEIKGEEMNCKDCEDYIESKQIAGGRCKHLGGDYKVPSRALLRKDVD